MDQLPSWSEKVLKAAGIYNIIWGAWVVLFPNSFFAWFELELPVYPMIWQSVGMIVGVYGIGYYIASSDPMRHWPIILVGWMGKLFGPLGALFYLIKGDLTPWFLLHNLTNDVIWLPYFTVLLYFIVKNSQYSATLSRKPLQEVIQTVTTNSGSTLSEISQGQTVFVIFLRHFGCTFCRETLFDLQKNLNQVERLHRVVIVHMSDSRVADAMLSHYKLETVEHISDPECVLYEAFSIPRGKWHQLFGPQVWWRGLVAGLFKGHGIGRLKGDGFRMPGLFILESQQIKEAYYYQTAADQVNLVAFAKRYKAKQLITE